MDFISNAIKTVPLVISVLKNNFESRDDDNILLLAIWEIQAKNISSFDNFKELLINGDLATPSTVIRTRRRLQLKYPDLRGNIYYDRQKADKIIRNQIKFNFDF